MTVLYVVSGAAPPVTRIRLLVERAQARGWGVVLTLTPTAAGWLTSDIPDLEKLTGYSVRSEFGLPSDVSGLPPADAMIVCPATFNMINKCAAGIGDVLAASMISEAIGSGLPVVVLPHFDTNLAAHPVLASSVGLLRKWGVTVLLGEGAFEPHPPKQGRLDEYPWDVALQAVET